MTTSLYLASKSPRRRELLEQVGVPYQVLDIDVEEVPRAGETPDAYVLRLAQEKARAGWRLLRSRGLPSAPVLGADTIGDCDGRVLEKPRDEHDAIAMLSMLSGRSHRVCTAVALADGERCLTALVSTTVWFKPLTEHLIRRYWATGEPRDKAGAYAIQGLGAVFVERIEGSYSGVVGLPLAQTCELLSEFQVEYWRISGLSTESTK